jgi:hypothetical protein
MKIIFSNGAVFMACRNIYGTAHPKGQLLMSAENPQIA